MCGIYGEIGRVDNDRVINGSILMQSRGVDSTGYMAMKENGEVVVVKDVYHARQFFMEYPLTDKLRWIFVHTRGASCGSVSPQNAHPFDVGTIIGMQNGFLFNHEKIAKEAGLPPRDVDSHSLIDLIQLHGEPMDFGKLWAGAIIWWDKDKKELNMADNTYANLYKCHQGGTIGYASTTRCLIECGFYGRLVSPVVRETVTIGAGK